MADIKSDSLTFVVGLGNRDITPDALGTEVVSRLLVTHHIKQNMKDYKQQESSLLDVIYRKFLGEALTEEEKKQIKAGIKEGLEGLAGQIPGMTEIKVRIDCLPSSTVDVMLDSTFESAEALKTYSTHPKHVAVADSKVRPYTAVRSCMDYEI